MTPEERLKQFEQELDERFDGRDGPTRIWLSDPYLGGAYETEYEIWISSGYRKEGSAITEVKCYDNPDAAVDAYIKALNLLGRSPIGSGDDDERVIGKLYWRIRPRLEYYNEYGWIVYSRFLITPHEVVENG